jgi:hypothetical protein
MAKTELKYKTFQQLLDEVITDFHTLSLEGMIDSSQLIRVAQRVNYELGLRIHKPKDVILEITNGKARLPLDFYVLNHANICGTYTVQEPVISGTHIEEKVLNPYYENNNPCSVGTCISPCGNYINLVQKLQFETRTYDVFFPLHVDEGRLVSKDCPNTRIESTNYGKLKDGFLFTNLQTGNVHMNYMGNMEDEDGNLLVLDHPMINEFYEYALKQRILENLMMNGEDVMQRISLIEQRMRAARNNALSIANTPDYAEMEKLWETNRKAQYARYYAMFHR